MTTPHTVYLEDQLEHRERLYTSPCEIITAHTPDEVKAALVRLQKCQADGLYLAGYFAYELGYLLDPALSALFPKTFTGPLIQFGAFKTFQRAPLPFQGRAEIGAGTPLWTQRQYRARFEKIMAYIKAGDVYQINLSFPVIGKYSGSAAAIYHHVKARQPVKYGGVVSLGGDDIVSLSPELFFETKNGNLYMRPMKGTCKRGVTKPEDAALAKALQTDPKNRAENLMIVDLLRNDMSRLSKAGSVNVTDLFSVETFPTLHTMTSGIEAKMKTGVDLPQILRALFPCGSITGAPKIRAQEIISELEGRSRGAYCGAIGLIDPNGDMRFNVAIRTINLKSDGTYSYPVGSGVVADSDGVAEYEECLLKAAVLRTDYQLIETFGWDEMTGFMHLDVHLERLKASAKTLGFAYDEDAVLACLNICVGWLQTPHKVRLTLAKNGRVQVHAEPLAFTAPEASWPIALCKNPLSSTDPLLAHKTTRRTFIDGERARIQALTGCKEVVFFNEKGELCEGSYTNVFVEIDGHLYTPPVSAGLLPGVLRRVLLAIDEVEARSLTLQDMLDADALFIGNSVRGLLRAHLDSPQTL